MTKKKMISILLIVVSLLSFCSFSVYADDFTINVSNMVKTMYREVDNGQGGTTQDYFKFTEGTETRNGVLCHWFIASDPAFYNANARKVTATFTTAEVMAGHEYEVEFYAGFNFRASYKVTVTLGGSEVCNFDFTNVDGLSKVSAKFTAPSSVTGGAQLKIVLSLNEDFSYGSAGQSAKFLISEEVKFTDLTENPSWLGKILNKFSEVGQSIRNLGTTIGNFFTNLGESIGGFFKDLWANIKQKFDDLKTWIDGLGEDINQWFIDLGNDISEFFTMLKNYLLYFQHPVTVNADGVLIGKDGKPVYTNPFDSAIDKVKETVDDWLTKINDFVDGMEQSRLDVTGYLESGTGVVNKVLKASPILTACVVFAVGFLVIRKVVGR